MKIVLVRPNYHSHIITPPLGLGYLASYLQKCGIKVRIIDALKNDLTQEKIVEKILAEKPDAVGITCLTAFYSEVVALSRILKSEGLRVIVGGVHPTFLPYQTLVDSKADLVVCGEGEVAFAQLIKNNFNQKNIQGVFNLNDLRKNKQVIKTKTIENLDLLPFPDWKQMDPRSYPLAPHGTIINNYPIGIIMTTRGCPYQCTFCASRSFYDQRVRFRSPVNVVREIKYLVKNFGVKEICFEDDNLTLRREHVEKICNLIIQKKIKISWACPNGIRADGIDEDLMRLMKKSGCYQVAYGIESANPRILKKIKKLETIDIIEKSIRLASRLGIECQGFFIFGLPGETEKTIEETIRFAKNSALSRAQFLILDILPGSDLWFKLKGKFSPNWNKKSYQEPEWIPKGLTKKKLIGAQAKAFREFYFRPSIFFRIVKSFKMRQVKYMLKRLIDYHLIKPR